MRRAAFTAAPVVVGAMLLVAAACWLGASSARAAPAPADSAAAAPPAAGGLSGLVKNARAVQDSARAAYLDSLVAAAGDSTRKTKDPLVLAWTQAPLATLAADVRTVSYSGQLTSNLILRGQATLEAVVKEALEDYRKQDKTVETRDGSLTFVDLANSRFLTNASLRRSWSEDRTVNAASNANVNKRDFRQARVAVDSLRVWTGPVMHAMRFSGGFDDQKGSSLGLRNDFSEGTANAAVGTRLRAAPGVTVLTTLYGERTSGERALGQQTDPSSSSGDTLGARLTFGRGSLQGWFSARTSSFDRKYLDYRRNANGIIDTLGAAQKIVQELEQNDAVSLEWNGNWGWRGVKLGTRAARDLKKNTYSASGVGLREDHQDRFNVNLGLDLGPDSLSVGYSYLWRWDNQTYKGATAPRGRQISKRRDVRADWVHPLFRHTRLRVNAQAGLQQDIAERRFNENDRDRLETSFTSKLESTWGKDFLAGMAFAYRRVEDIAIRPSRSANNTVKDTYEITPGYNWLLAPWLRLQQDFRMSIQFTDYVYSGYPGVSSRDDYNKRGNLNSKVTIRPNPRLTLAVSHDYNARFNASKTSSDAAGTDYYAHDLEQRISAIELAVSYRVSNALTLEGATERTKDVKETFGNRGTVQDRRGGKIWVGGVFKQEWGGQGSGKEISARVRKYYAYGPNVQEANSDYWDADISMGWKF